MPGKWDMRETVRLKQGETVEDGDERIIAGTFLNADQRRIDLRTEWGDTVAVSIRPAIRTLRDMRDHPGFRTNVQRSMHVRSEGGRWIATANEALREA